MIRFLIGYDKIRISPILLIWLNRDSLLPYITAIFFIFSQAQDMILPDNIYQTTNRWPLVWPQNNPNASLKAHYPVHHAECWTVLSFISLLQAMPKYLFWVKFELNSRRKTISQAIFNIHENISRSLYGTFPYEKFKPWTSRPKE